MGGGNPVAAITDPISSALGTDGGGGGLLGAVEDVGEFIGDAGEVIDKNVIQPAVQDPVGTAVKIAAIAAAPATGGTSLYAIPAYTATKAIAAGVPIEDVAKMAAISAAATYAGVSVADYVGTLAEFGTEIGSQQTAMLAAQNVGIGTGNVVSTAAGQIVGGAVSGTVNAAATGRDPVTGLLTGAANTAIGQGVNLAVDTAGNLFTPSTAPTNVVASNTSGITSDVGVDPTYQAWLNAINSGDVVQNRPLTPAELQAAGITTGTTGMDENLFYDTSAYYSPDYVAPNLLPDGGVDYGQFNLNTGTGEDFNMSGDPQFNAYLQSTPGLLDYAKRFGVQAAKALIGGGPRPAGTGGTTGGTGTQGGLLGAGANYFLSDAARRAILSASQQSAAQQLADTRRAEQFATFRPIGTTTAFGQSNFGFDPTTGQLVSAGYTATPQVAAQREKLFTLGAEALPTTTDTAALQQQYINQQRGLLAPSREQQFAQLRNRTFQRGTSGLATGGTVAGYTPESAGLMQTNPEMAAYFNALAREDATLAANAPTYAQDLLNKRIATGTNLFTQAGALETMAQQPLTLGQSLGTAAAGPGANAGLFALRGGQGAAATQLAGTTYGATGQLGQMQGLLGGVSPYLQQAGNYAINNWLV